MNKTRVLVTDDSLTVRKHLLEVLSADLEFVVIGEASNGREAVELCERLHPDVISMDMVMPVMNGLAATEAIMAYCPTPILIVSASTNRGEILQTFDALAAGAVDVLDKASAGEVPAWDKRFLDRLRLVARIQPITHPRARLKSSNSPGRVLAQRIPPARRPSEGGSADAVSELLALRSQQPATEIIAIGASTGGPAVLAHILSRIPVDFPLPILLVIHLAKEFAQGFVEWLNGESRVGVRYALDCELLPRPGKGQVIMAPPDRHLVVNDGFLQLTTGPERNLCRPSVDILFESAARIYGPRATACLLTGMGSDGATGLLAVRREGGVTIAQDESSSTVFGMPRAAIERGAALAVLPLAEFVPALCLIAGLKPRSTDYESGCSDR
jgi:two-component system, chemotaxis family, protein-glutamate methylesterase/glutaminase